jgi:hypothetical protein
LRAWYDLAGGEVFRPVGTAIKQDFDEAASLISKRRAKVHSLSSDNLSSDTYAARAEAEIATALGAALGQLIGDMMIGYALQRPNAETGLREAREALLANIAKFSFTATTVDGRAVDTSEELRRRVIERIDAAEAFARRKIGLPARPD